MLGRLAAVAASCIALSFVSCGTATSVTTSPTFDSGCADPSTVIADGGGVIEPAEAGAPECPAGVCNYQAQTGCSGGEACRPQFTATSPDVTPGCEPAGTGKSGATCASGADCATGYFCADGVCRKQCCHRDWSACDAGESCFRDLQVEAGGVVTDSGMDLCFPVGTCDLFDSSSCAQGLACTIVDPTGAVACLPANGAQVGASCADTNLCVAGAYCVDDGEGPHCRALCRADICGQPACAAGQGTCIHFKRDPVGVGECTLE